MLSRYGGYSSSGSGSLFSFRSARARINTSNQNSHNNYWHFKNYDGGNTRPRARPAAPPQPARPALASSSGVDPGLVTSSSASTRVNPADWAQVGASTIIVDKFSINYEC